jgi:3-dehydroquinate dehydratase-2
VTKVVHVLNGPNLDLLGEREPEIYGSDTLKDVEAACRAAADRLGWDLVFRQTNAEHQMVEWLHATRRGAAAGVVMNPAGFCYHSVPVLDALKMCDCPVVEVHISNIHRREAEWRARTLTAGAAVGMISGFGGHGYVLGIEYLARAVG